jgi:hypothetical protein
VNCYYWNLLSSDKKLERQFTHNEWCSFVEIITLIVLIILIVVVVVVECKSASLLVSALDM